MGMDILQAMGVLQGGGAPPTEGPSAGPVGPKHSAAAPGGAPGAQPQQSIWQMISGNAVTLAMSLFINFVNGFLGTKSV